MMAVPFRTLRDIASPRPVPDVWSKSPRSLATCKPLWRHWYPLASSPLALLQLSNRIEAGTSIRPPALCSACQSRPVSSRKRVHSSDDRLGATAL